MNTRSFFVSRSIIMLAALGATLAFGGSANAVDGHELLSTDGVVTPAEPNPADPGDAPAPAVPEQTEKGLVEQGQVGAMSHGGVHIKLGPEVAAAGEDSTITSTATCDPDEVAYGGGYDTGNLAGSVDEAAGDPVAGVASSDPRDLVGPDTIPDAWRAILVNADVGTSIQAFAICGPDLDTVDGGGTTIEGDVIINL